jgi:Apea-like HEPN
MATKQNRKQAAVADLDFVLSECARVQQLLRNTRPSEFSKLGPLSSLPSPSGPGGIPCSVEAVQRLHDLSATALQHSDASGTIEPEKVFRAFERIVVQRFVDEQRALDEAQVERALAAAIKEAKRSRLDAMHIIPCRLMRVKSPRDFSIGPVKFRDLASFDEQMEPLYATYLETGETPQQVEIGKLLLPAARHYYEGFTWVAEVKVLNCDPGISEERAYLAVTAALDCLHLLFGGRQSKRMSVGGSRMAEDRRAHLYLDADGALQVSTSSNATSEVGFKDDWSGLLDRPDIAFFLRAAGKAIEPLTNPAIDRPLGMRFVDAAAWFGQAAREMSDAGRIVKAVSALERLVMTGKCDDIAELLSQRAAAVCYDPERIELFGDTVAKVKKAYDLRSELVHGSISPFAAKVKDSAPVTMHLIERALCGGLGFFESELLLDRCCTNAQLAAGFSRLLEWARTHSAGRSAPPQCQLRTTADADIIET